MKNCQKCNQVIEDPIHHIGEDFPIIQCSQCDPSTRFSRYEWDGRTWRCITKPNHYKTKEIRDYLLSCGVRCVSFKRDRLLSIIADIDKDVTNINKYVPNDAKVVNYLKIDIDGEQFLVDQKNMNEVYYK